MSSIVLIKEIILVARTPKGGYTKKQIAAIGVEWPAKKADHKPLLAKKSPNNNSASSKVLHKKLRTNINSTNLN